MKTTISLTTALLLFFSGSLLNDFVAWLVCLGTAIAGIFKNQATLTDIGIPS
jgi:hypothetical protein